MSVTAKQINDKIARGVEAERLAMKAWLLLGTHGYRMYDALEIWLKNQPMQVAGPDIDELESLIDDLRRFAHGEEVEV